MNYEDYVKTADFIKEKLNGFQPDIGIILGTGLGNVSSRIENPIIVNYSDIPGFPVSTAPGHAGRFYFGTLAGRKVACMSGRFHSYEGYSYEQLSLPVRTLYLLGIKVLVVTNAAGAINTAFRPGDVMIITDHIKMTGDSPVRGKHIPEFGPMFFDQTHTYHPKLIEIARSVAKTSPVMVREGVYFFFTGPQFETPAEIRAARLLGGDAAGMSTVTETITAAQCSIPCLGLSLITNMAAGAAEEDFIVSGQDVDDTAKRVGPAFEEFFVNVIERIKCEDF